MPNDFSEETAINTRNTFRTTLAILILVFVTVLVFTIVYWTVGPKNVEPKNGKRHSFNHRSPSHATGPMVDATAFSSTDPCQQINAIFNTTVSSHGTALPISQILSQGLNMSAKRGLFFDSQVPSWIYTLYAPLCTGLQSPEINLDLARKACAALIGAVSKLPSTPTLVALNQAANALSTFFNNGANVCSNIGIGDNNYPAVTATDGTAFPSAALATLNNIWFQAAVGSQPGQTCAIPS